MDKKLSINLAELDKIEKFMRGFSCRASIEKLFLYKEITNSRYLGKVDIVIDIFFGHAKVFQIIYIYSWILAGVTFEWKTRRNSVTWNSIVSLNQKTKILSNQRNYEMLLRFG